MQTLAPGARRRLESLDRHLGSKASVPSPRPPGTSAGTAATPAALAPVPTQFEEVAASIRSDLTAHALPSLAVAVSRGGEVLWEQGFGWADREAREMATEHTSYSLASISKPITATGLAILVERGLVDLDTPIDEYLGAAKLNPGAAVLAGESGSAGATVRRVANHTSGLPLHYHFFYEDEPFARPPFEETILRYGNLVTPPGTHYQYSNLGYGLLDHVISNVSAGTYADFMTAEVFQPLGMTRTSVDITPDLKPYSAVRYAPNGARVPFYTFDHPGGSAVWSSAHDLVRFGMYHLHNTVAGQASILSDEMIDAMHTDTTGGKANPQEGAGYGIGWAVVPSRIGSTSSTSSAWKNWRPKIISHTGGMGGVATALMILPEHDIAIAVLCNASTSLPHCVSERILSVLLPDAGLVPTPMPEPLGYGQTDSDRPHHAQPTRPAAPTFKPKPDWLVGEWSGVLGEGREKVGDRCPIPLSMAVDADGRVYVRLGEQPWTLLDQAELEELDCKGGCLRGTFLGDRQTVDTNRRDYTMLLELRRYESGDRNDNVSLLGGSCVALSTNADDGVRLGNALTDFVLLRKQS